MKLHSEMLNCQNLSKNNNVVLDSIDASVNIKERKTFSTKLYNSSGS